MNTPASQPHKSPAPPAHLSREAKAWWRSVVNEFLDLDPHHLKLLQAAAESWDRMQQARAAIDASGTTFTDRFGCPKARPEVQIERDSRIAFARLVRELALDESSPDDSRPPRIGGNRNA